MFQSVSFFMLVEPIIRIILYIALIVLAYKSIEALNVYIRKNSR